MKLLCPLCGQETTVPGAEAFPCERCGGLLRREPYGKAFLLRPAEKPPAEGEDKALALVRKAEDIHDPVRKKAMLEEAEKLCLDSLTVQTELLHLGRLDQRDPRRIDYHVIKCYLLHVFEVPEDETPQQREEMLQELTGDPRLLRCLALASDQEEFLRGYLTRLCREYISLFFKGSSQHMQRIFGLQVVRPEKALAYPAAHMLINMARTELPVPFDRLLPECFISVFKADVGTDIYVQAARKELEA